MERVRYYTTRNEQSTIFEVWVYDVEHEETPAECVATCAKRGDANLIRKLLQDRADANRKAA